MKTTKLFLLIFLLSATGAYAQLVVNADGTVTFSSFKSGGYLAGFTGNSENTNVSFGYKTLSNVLTIPNGNNVAIGNGTLLSNTEGVFNTAVGQSALYNNTEGSYNVAVGQESLANNTAGYENSAYGRFSLLNNLTGSSNVAVGDWALGSNTTGNRNIAIGSWALTSNSTGSNNVAIGGTTSSSSYNLNNAIVIGYQASVTASNQARIGNSSVTSIGGYASWTNVSDGRIKKNIQTNVPGLSFINQLQPITYNLDLDAIDGLLKVKIDPRAKPLSPELEAINKKAREAKEKVIQTGFIAQDVEKIAQSVGYDFSGVDVDEVGIYGLRYAEFVVPLVKAVQELSSQNEQLQAQVTELTELVSSLVGKENTLRSDNIGASLQQNTPNPFSQSTIIRYTLPKTDKQAQMVISNTAGNIIKQIPLQAGTDSVTVEGGSLSAGIYYYSLYVGNGLVDTKKMVLTK